LCSVDQQRNANVLVTEEPPPEGERLVDYEADNAKIPVPM